MTRQLLIESDDHESRVAVCEAGRLVEVHIERPELRGEVGNIYKGRVTRILPGIQAAFVSIGLERDAYLFADDVERRPREANGARGAPGQGPPPSAISEVLEQGGEVLVQVTKELRPGKGARVSRQISLPGRFVVLLPGGREVGISRRITDPAERDRLQELLDAIRPPDTGLVARTAGAGRAAIDFERDLERLTRRWRELQRECELCDPPVRLHQELELPLRAGRDLLDDQTAEVWVSGVAAHRRLVDYLSGVDPALVERIHLASDDELLFERFGVEDELTSALRSQVWLDSGGYIVINSTEALVAIDVNTGRNIGSTELEDTAFETNLEAVTEIGRQIRLRDLSGIIVVDFIDMTVPEHRSEIVRNLEEELRKDRTRSHISQISEFGLIEITRKRARGGLGQRLTEPCPCCSGQGRIKSPATIALELRRTARKRRSEWTGRTVTLRAHPRLATALGEEQQAIVREIEALLQTKVRILSDAALLPDEYEIRGD